MKDWKWKTIIEPHRIKVVEPLGFTTDAERKEILEKAKYNMFNIPADKVLLDFLTDSGTGAMSGEQWAGVMKGDESYAGAKSYYNFEKAVKNLTGYKHILPVHQGRAAERILFSFLGGEGKCVISNAHFDTTRANVEASGTLAIDLPVKEALEFSKPALFKGNMDIDALNKTIAEKTPANIVMCIMTITNNSMGGQPVSMANIKEVSKICKKHGIPVFFDMARFAENAMFIKKYEKGYGNKTAKEIAQEVFTYGDGAIMSAKKDALVNMGGILAINSDDWNEKARQNLILGEGFLTYGGLAGRDLEAIAIGLEEVLDENYLEYRLASIKYLGDGLRRVGMPIVEPPGGHAVYINAKEFLPNMPAEKFPAQSVCCELYLEGGIRTVEVGTLMFGRQDASGKYLAAPMDLVRIAVPRRVYTQSHIDYVIEVCEQVVKKKDSIKGLKVTYAPKALAHFTAELAPLK